MLAEPTADTLENLTSGEHATRITTKSPAAECEPPAASEDELLREREAASTSEGMPSGELDEEPPKADSASAGE